MNYELNTNAVILGIDLGKFNPMCRFFDRQSHGSGPQADTPPV